MNWIKFRKRWLVPSVIAFVSLIISQLLLFRLESPILLQAAYFLGYLGVLSVGTRTFGFVFIYRVMIPITFGILFVALYKEVYLIPELASFLESSRTNEKYLVLLFDILATLYAICTAFLLWKGLTDHDNLRLILSDEANYMERLIGYMRYFDMSKKKFQDMAARIHVIFHAYIQNIVGEDEIKVSKENSVLLRQAVEVISEIKPEDDNDRIALAETMKCLSNLAMARSQRISQMEIKMSPYLLMVLGIMSVFVIYPFFTEAPSDDFVIEICIFILGSLLSFLLVTLVDISRPFNGFWKIKVDSFQNIIDVLDQESEYLKSLQSQPAKK